MTGERSVGHRRVRRLHGSTLTDPAAPRGSTPRAPSGISLLLIGVFASAVAGARRRSTRESLVPAIWPAGGLIAGLLLTSPTGCVPACSALVFVLMLAAHLLQRLRRGAGARLQRELVAAAWRGPRSRLVRGLDGRRAALLDQGDVSRLIGAIAAGVRWSPASAAG